MDLLNQKIKEIIVLNFKAILISILGLFVFGINIANYYILNRITFTDIDSEEDIRTGNVINSSRDKKNILLVTSVQSIITIAFGLAMYYYVLTLDGLDIIRIIQVIVCGYILFSLMIFGTTLHIRYNFNFFNYCKAVLFFPMLQPFHFLLVTSIYLLLFYLTYMFPPIIVFVYFPISCYLNLYIFTRVSSKINM